MKWFYIISLAMAAILCSFPLVILKDNTSRSGPPGSVHNLLYSSDVKSLDPATCGDEMSSIIQANFYEGLYAYHYLKRPVEVVEQLADSMPQVSADGLTYTIRIKRGMLFHRNPCFGKDPSGEHPWNTRSVTAADFVLAIKRVADYHINTGLSWAFLAERVVGLDEFREKTRQFKAGDFSRYDLNVEGVSAPDSLTLRLRLRTPFPQLIYVLAMHVYAPIPHEVVEYHLSTSDDGHGGRRPVPLQERSTEIMDREQVVGTGPYLLSGYKRKWKIELRQNPDFREDFYPSDGEKPSAEYPGDSAKGLLADAGKRVPFFQTVNLRYIEEDYAAWMLFLSRQIDVGPIPIETFQAIITPGKELTDEWKNKDISLTKAVRPVIYWLVFNMEDPLLGKSRALRRALCLSYDVENLVKILYNGLGRRAVNIVPSSFRGHGEAGPGPFYRLDTAAALREIAEAKKELRAAGLLVNGEIPELKLDLSDGPYSLRMADFSRQQFSRLGIKVKCIFNDWPTLQRKVENKQVQMYYMGWVADYPDAENFLQLFFSGNIDKGTNNSNYHNPAYDSLYLKVRAMRDSPERLALYTKMIRMVCDDVPVLLLNEPEGFALFYNRIKNVKQHPIGYGFTKYRRIDTKYNIGDNPGKR
jgi:oligopeptide transport system substrate-binding protein